MEAPDPIDPHADVDALVDRAQNLLGFMSDDEAIKKLADSGAPWVEAYLAVAAAKILIKDQSELPQADV